MMAAFKCLPEIATLLLDAKADVTVGDKVSYSYRMSEADDCD
jgi:hypothetical protein